MHLKIVLVITCYNICETAGNLIIIYHVVSWLTSLWSLISFFLAASRLLLTWILCPKQSSSSLKHFSLQHFRQILYSHLRPHGLGHSVQMGMMHCIAIAVLSHIIKSINLQHTFIPGFNHFCLTAGETKLCLKPFHTKISPCEYNTRQQRVMIDCQSENRRQ